MMRTFALWIGLGVRMVRNSAETPASRRALPLSLSAAVLAAVGTWNQGMSAKTDMWDVLPVITTAIMLAGALTFPLLLNRLSARTIVQSYAFWFLVLAGLGASLAFPLLHEETERRLNEPDLNPVLASHGKKPLTTETVELLRNEVKGKGWKPLFGRFMAAAVQAYVVQPEADRPPACDAVPPVPQEFKVMAISGAEPVHLEWRWQAQPPSSAGVLHRDVQFLPLGMKLPGFTSQSKIPQLYLSIHGMDELGLKEKDSAVPRWICLDDRVGQGFRLYAVAALLGQIPNFEIYDFSFVVSEDVGRRISTAEGYDPAKAAYALLAIRLDRQHRREMLDWIGNKAAQGDFSPEEGFTKRVVALRAADAASNLGLGFGVFVVLITALYAGNFVWQSIDGCRRELLVARAFGARLNQVALLIVTLLGFPLLVALVQAAFCVPAVAALVARITVDFELEAITPRVIWIALGIVAAAGIILVLVTATVVLGVWWWKTRSLASRLQEDG